MSYRVTDHLWTTLANEERSIRWLARKAGCTHNYLNQLKSGRKPAVSEELAARIAAVFGVPISTLFENVNAPTEQEAAAD